MRRRFPCREGFVEVRDGRAYFQGVEVTLHEAEGLGVRSLYKLRRALKEKAGEVEPLTAPDPVPLFDVEEAVTEEEVVDVDMG